MDSKIECICNVLEEINGFHSINEFERFLVYIYNLVNDTDLVEIPVEIKYGGSNILQEKWYKCSGCNQKWRLVYPDFPFEGLWKEV
ncbi:hypothetical protein [Halalkalibacter urbisdiaboli]|uniref:hypothetical protein n=1 Tax=Halalkalibacter urbisdiaboli TaxID=1960589 RepID=UPI000B450141|nr:hypothetical protein [Halalkalibacter urbisdiaboli]